MAKNRILDRLKPQNVTNAPADVKPIQAEKQETTFPPELLVVGINTPTCSTFLIDKETFVFGKQGGTCDGLLDFSKEISRKHAQIIWRDGNYYIVDMGSTNKTLLNSVQLVPNQEYRIQTGDQISFSAYTYRVEKLLL